MRERKSKKLAFFNDIYFGSQIFFPVLFTLLAFFLSSCQGKSKRVDIAISVKTNLEKAYLEKAEEFVLFPLDSLTPTFSWSIQYVPLDNELYYLNRSRNELNVFSLTEGIKTRKIKFQKEGAEGVGKISGFHVYEKDSILIVSNMKNWLHWVDSESNIIEKVILPKPEDKRILFPFINTFLPLVSDNSTFYFPFYPEGMWSQVDDFSEQNVSGIYNFKDDSYSLSGVTYPLDYYEEAKKEPIFSRLKVGENTVYSFFGDHHLYVTKDHKTYQKKVEIKSSLMQSFISFKDNMSMSEYLTYIAETSAYYGILHDPYRDVIYRFVALGYDLKPQDNVQVINRFPPKLSIQIIDAETFDFLGETQLDYGKHYWANSFVTTKGLYVSTASPLNENYSEDVLLFELFELDFK